MIIAEATIDGCRATDEHVWSRTDGFVGGVPNAPLIQFQVMSRLRPEEPTTISVSPDTSQLLAFRGLGRRPARYLAGDVTLRASIFRPNVRRGEEQLRRAGSYSVGAAAHVPQTEREDAGA